MAQALNVMRTCGLLMYLIFCVNANVNNASEPRIISLKLESKNCDDVNCKYLLNMKGGEFLGHYSWRLTPVDGSGSGECDVIFPNYDLKELSTMQWSTKFEIILPITESKVYFCIYKNNVKNSPFGGKWVHQGPEHYLDVKNEDS